MSATFTPLYHPKLPKSYMADVITHTLGRELQLMLFLNHMVRPSKKSLELHLQPQVKYPKFQHETPKSRRLWQIIY